LRHGEERKILADGIFGTGNIAEIFSVVGIGVGFIGDQRCYYGGRDGGGVPAGGVEAGGGDLFSGGV
jgi:hypothetical protein